MLRSWMTANRVSIAWVARQLNIAQSSASALLRGDRIPLKRHSQLVKIGIPEELLPRAEDVKRPGRPPMVPMLDADGRILQVLPEGQNSTME